MDNASRSRLDVRGSLRGAPAAAVFMVLVNAGGAGAAPPTHRRRRVMRVYLSATLALLVGAAAAGKAAGPELKPRVIERFKEGCSAVQLILITRSRDLPPNVTLEKGQRSRYIDLDEFASKDIPSNHRLHGEMGWHCGDTAEDSECDNDATHVRVSRAATGRVAAFTCYRIESCEEGTTTLDTLDDKCGEETLWVGGRGIKFLQTVENIPFSAAKLTDSGGVRWHCGTSPERSNCPAGTTLLTVERRDRDTRTFHISCLRAGAKCEAYHGKYPPN